MSKLKVYSCFLALLFTFAASSVRAEEEGTEPTEKEKELLATVSKRLLDKMAPVPGYQWPPKIDVVASKELNAWTWAEENTVFPELKPKAFIVVTTPWMRKIVRGEEDVLALTVGHELGHIHYRHTITKKPGDTKLVQTFYQREREYEADDFGVDLLLKAGYSLRKAIRGDTRIKVYTKRHAPLDTITDDHAGWNDRYMRMLRDPKYWRAMNDFDNGVAFLTAEQYHAAMRCFDRVRKEFPASYEAWVNYGYAILMLYCDKLDEKDIVKMDVGHVVCGGFYRRAASLTPPNIERYPDEKLWNEAVGAFGEALRIKPDLALAKANLALAYLLHPEAKQVGEARRLYQEAIEIVRDDATLDPVARAMLLINLGVTQLAAEQREEGLKLLEEGMTLAKTLKVRESQPLTEAVLYNRALAKSGSSKPDDRKQAVAIYEEYLVKSDPLSAWWPVAYAKYKDLCKDVGGAARAQEDLQKGRKPELRKQTTLVLNGGKEVSVSELMADVLPRFSKPKTTPIAGVFTQYVFEKENFELLASDRVIAIILRSPEAPEVALHPMGLSTEVSFKLKVGMDSKDVDAMLPDPNDYFHCELTEKKKFYLYYRNLGIAIRYDKHPTGKITELILAEIPR